MNSKNLTKQSLLSKGFLLFFLYAIPTIACCFKPHIIQAEFFEVPKYCIYVSQEYSCPHQLSLYPSFQWMVPQIPPEVFRVPSKSSSLPSPPLPSSPPQRMVSDNVSSIGNVSFFFVEQHFECETFWNIWLCPCMDRHKAVSKFVHGPLERLLIR